MPDRWVEIEQAVRVELRYVGREDRLGIEFLEWQAVEGVFPIRGSGASSPAYRWGGEWQPGYWIGYFHTDDWPKVRAWLVEKGLNPGG